MRISFSPQRRPDTLTVSKFGDVLTINGDTFDFTALPDGATLPAEESPSKWISGPVDRVDGEIHLTLVLPHGPNPAPGYAFPRPIRNVPDGTISLPGEANVGG